MQTLTINDETARQLAELAKSEHTTPAEMMERMIQARLSQAASGGNADPEHAAWFAAKVQEALSDPRPPVPHAMVMSEAQALIDRKRHAKA